MPAVIPIVIALTAASTTAAVVGQIRAGNAQAAAGDAAKAAGEQANELEQFNADVALEQSRDAVLRGHQEETNFRMGLRGLIGSQRAGFAGQNVDVGSGSAVDVQADAAYLGELDALTIRANASREAWGHIVESQRATARGKIDLQQGEYAAQAGEAAQTASRFQAAGTILGTAGSLVGMKYGFDRASR